MAKSASKPGPDPLPEARVLLSVTIPGKPLGKQRPRVAASGGVYTPQKQVNYEHTLAWTIKREIRALQPTAAPCQLGITIVVERPKRPHPPYPCVTPDIDNVVKSVCDALNGLLWVDDRQVVKLDVERHWGAAHQMHIEVTAYPRMTHEARLDP